MHPHAHALWPAPRWTLALLLALLATVGPFAIDTYIPAFGGIAADLRASPLQMQQTLSAYLFGFAAMNLFHGALADSFGRRPVVLWGMAVFTLASVGCALAGNIAQLIGWRFAQGLAAGAGIVVSRAIIRDMFPPAEAQRVMSQVTIYFGVAPAIAPLIGGWLYVHLDWRAVFGFLALVGALLWSLNLRLLPETLHPSQRQAFNPNNLLRGYWQLLGSARFLLLALASGVPFNGMFLYVLSAPAFLGHHLQLAPTQYFWLFLLTIAGIMGGSWFSGRLAGRITPRRQIRMGFTVMLTVSLLNVAANALFEAHAAWALLPIAVFAFGWALMMPVVMLLVLDLFPDRRGMASSLQATVGAAANGLVAGVIAPLVMHATLTLALASALMMTVGLTAWLVLRRRWPDIGEGTVGTATSL